MKGVLRKMQTKLSEPVEYWLPLSDEKVHLNPYIGKKIHIGYSGNIYCLDTGKLIKKSYGQGYSYEAFMRLASCDMCILKPETCHYHKGTCREPKWGEENCMKPHIVYLSNTSGIKIGITRESQVPTRWIDQGARYALPILRVFDRKTAGEIENEIKQGMNDKTNWQQMLRGDPNEVDLEEIREQLFDEFAELLDAYELEDLEEPTVEIQFPVEKYPEKVKALNLDKSSEISGTLLGIKGQYLILDTGVLNVRKFGGYEIEFTGE